MRFSITMIPILFAVASCSASSSHDHHHKRKPQVEGEWPKTEPDLPLADRSAGILFAGTDARFQSSNLYLLHMADDKVEEVLTGQSGDPLIQNVGNDVYLFNRQPGNLNYRKITTLDAKPKRLGNQQAIKGLQAGDPHAVLSLGDDHALLANYVTGQLSVVDLNSGSTLQNLSRNWGLPSRAPLRPEAFFEGKNIYVLHQGLSDSFDMNETQRILVLQRDAKEFDASRRSIAIDGSNPLGFFYKENQSPLILSLCFRGAQNCRAALERFDAENEKVSLLMDLTDAGYGYNGMACIGESTDIVYANAEKQVNDGTYKQFIIKINATDKTVTVVHEFSTRDFGGYSWIFFHEPTRQLFVGDRRDMRRGNFTVYIDDKRSRVIDVDVIPYSGTVINW